MVKIQTPLRYVAAPKKYRGFTFIGLMVIVSIMGVGLLAVGEMWHTAQQRAKEQTLLFVGDQFRRAIKAYYLHTPPANKQLPYPMSLDALLKDPRYPSTQRYLRQIYPDPMTNATEWGLLKQPNGAIYGVYSLSEATPIKQANFKLADKDFAGKSKYTEWQFVYLPAQNTKQPVATQ